MENQSEVSMNNSSIILNLISWIFGILFSAIGFINTFWGNDPGYGIFIICLSLVYFPPLYALFQEKTHRSIPRVIKILLGLFILWTALGVAELPAKIDLMMQDF